MRLLGVGKLSTMIGPRDGTLLVAEPRNLDAIVGRPVGPSRDGVGEVVAVDWGGGELVVFLGPEGNIVPRVVAPGGIPCIEGTLAYFFI